MKLKKPKFWDYDKPNFLALLLFFVTRIHLPRLSLIFSIIINLPWLKFIWSRIILETNDINLSFDGKIDDSGRCIIPIKKFL